MERHADVVRNDWKAGKQAQVGQVLLTEYGDVRIDCADHHLAEKLAEPVSSATGGGALLTVADGEAFVAALARRWTGDYVLVTSIHEASECPFITDSVVAMKSHLSIGN